MSPRIPAPCPHPGCPTLTAGGPCPKHRRARRRHQAQKRRQAGDPGMTAYSTTAWRHHRTRYLSRHPNCVDCGQAATQPDHTPPRALLLALGIHDPDDERWLQPRCASCHAAKTRTIDAPILARLRAGEDATQLAHEATQLEAALRRTR